MLQEFFLQLSLYLFYLTNGAALMNTLWFIPWIIGGALIITVIAVVVIPRGQFTGLFVVILAFPLLLFVIAPPMIQQQLLNECEKVPVTISTDKVESATMDVEQCRFKDNYYDEFGKWVIMNARDIQ